MSETRRVNIQRTTVEVEIGRRYAVVCDHPTFGHDEFSGTLTAVHAIGAGLPGSERAYDFLSFGRCVTRAGRTGPELGARDFTITSLTPAEDAAA